jgi:Domain of unknown function (DUF6933)
MITLRCTKKLQKQLGVKPEPEDREPTAALGDWYGNLVLMPVGPALILITNERSLLSVVMGHDADVPAELRRRVVALMRRLEIPEAAIEREAFELQQIRVGKTNNRRVLGSMNDAVLLLEARLFDDPGKVDTLERVEDALAENLYSMLDYEHPSDVARALLGAPPRPRRVVELALEVEPAPVSVPVSVPVSEAVLAPVRELPGHRSSVRGREIAREKIAPGQRVAVRLSPRDRVLLLEHVLLLDQGLTEVFERVSLHDGELAVGVSLEELDEMLGCVAAEANHCKSEKLQGELDRFYERLRLVMESYDDGSWREGG